MPTQMTFDSLQDDVRNYLERGSVNDPTVYEQLPALINFAERRISRELKILGFKLPANFVMQAGVATYAKPDRWRETASMNVGDSAVGTAVRNQMYPRSYEYIRNYWPDDSATWFSVYGVQGVPLFYSDYDYQHFIVAPTPDQAYPCELVYYEQPPLLDITNQVNWITQYTPRLLLYATLIEASVFIKKDDRVATWQSLFDREAGMVNGEDQGRMMDDNTARQKD